MTLLWHQDSVKKLKSDVIKNESKIAEDRKNLKKVKNDLAKAEKDLAKAKEVKASGGSSPSGGSGTSGTSGPSGTMSDIVIVQAGKKKGGLQYWVKKEVPNLNPNSNSSYLFVQIEANPEATVAGLWDAYTDKLSAEEEANSPERSYKYSKSGLKNSITTLHKKKEIIREGEGGPKSPYTFSISPIKKK